MITIAMGSDHAGYSMKEALKKHLAKTKDVSILDFGTDSEESCDYPEFAKAVARAVAGGKADRGVLVCGTGIGMSIAANKIRGIRAAVVGDAFSAEATREHNDANILCLGARVIGLKQAEEYLDIFLRTPFSNGENHIRRIGKLEELMRDQIRGISKKRSLSDE